jgi:DNA-binding protein YbaB
MAKATAGLKKSTTKTHYEEWFVEIKIVNGKREVTKIKISRPRVLMSEANAETLNEGTLNMDLQNNNRLPLYYFSPEPKPETV